MEPRQISSAQDLARHIKELQERLAPRLPEIDPGDLLLILECLHRPPGSGRRFLLRQVRPGVHVP